MKIKQFDVIIFGASGGVGKYTVLEAIKVFKDLKWAIAGRSKHKLELLLEEISLKTATDCTTIPILIANANDLKELKDLVEKCQVLINCCGPYQLLAENILTSCILAGTHYVDMCCDPYFNELMTLKYHEKAEENHVYIISACGFHSFPIEMALNFLRQNFNGTVNHVDAFVRYNFFNHFHFPIFPLWSATAWYSLLWSCLKAGDLPLIRHELRQTPLTELLPKQPIEELYQRTKYQEQGFMVHVPFIDQQIVEHSQYLFYEQDKLRPIQFYKYLEFPYFIWAFLFILWCLIISILSQFVKFRKILINHSKLCTIGMFSSDGPDDHIVQMSSYKITLNATGWSQTKNVNDVTDQCMNIEISGKNPYYGCGCLCLLLSVKTILEESDKMPGKGGVYSPGFAFYKTDILGKLNIFQNYFRITVL